MGEDSNAKVLLELIGRPMECILKHRKLEEILESLERMYWLSKGPMPELGSSKGLYPGLGVNWRINT